MESEQFPDKHFKLGPQLAVAFQELIPDNLDQGYAILQDLNLLHISLLLFQYHGG